MAHAIVRDSEVGDLVFLGFHRKVREAKIGDGAVLLHRARVLGVEVPSNGRAGGETVAVVALARD